MKYTALLSVQGGSGMKEIPNVRAHELQQGFLVLHHGIRSPYTKTIYSLRYLLNADLIPDEEPDADA